jgi:type I pantothenate kinase
MQRKGFPESYDVRRLVRFMADVKSGSPEVVAPIYSHLTYDIVPDKVQTIRQPDILIVEGLNMLQRGDSSAGDASRVFVSDFFDFSIYVDADEDHLHQWYVERFLSLRETAFRDPASYFRRYADLSSEEARQVATRIWNEINAVNLHANIEPTRERARLILEKGSNHLVQSVRLRKL